MSSSTHRSAVWFLIVGLLALAAFVALFVAFGPTRQAPTRLMGACLASSVIFTGIGLIRWWRSARTRADPSAARRRIVWTILAVLGGAAALGSIVFALYAHWWEQASRPCRLAERAALRGERERLLAEAAPWRERVAFFGERVYMCGMVEEDLAQLDATGQCPRYVMRDVPCQCGLQQWPSAWPHTDLPRCDRFDEQGNSVATPNLLRRRSWEQ